MASLTAEAQRFITRNNLGTPLEVYGPSTAAQIITGLFVMIFAIFWTAFALVITGSSLLPASILFPISTPTFSASTLGPIFTFISIIFPLFGLLFFFLGVRMIWKAIYNRSLRAIICTRGMAYVQPTRLSSFYWPDVLTTSSKVDVKTTYNHSTRMNSTRIYHIYTVHCHDGRKFVFRSPLARVQDLGESVDVQVARARHGTGQNRQQSYY